MVSALFLKCKACLLPWISTALNVILMLLAVTDISVGLVSQPLLIARKFMEIYNVHDCVLWTAMRSTVYYFSGISFLTITLVSVERWFAVCKPIKHRRDVTSTRMGVVASVVWSAWFIFPVVRFAVPKFYRAFAMLIGGIIIIVFIINAMLYVKIHHSVREGKLKFTSEAHEKRSKDNVNFRKEGRLAKTVALLLVIMVSAYLPTAIGLTYKALRGVNTIYLFVFLPLADTLVLMNSSFNPLFYCYRNAKIRMEFLKRLNIQTASKSCDSSLNNRSTSKV
ncbi:growth hormone secretagogue receptor type 1-like [Dendronephthya gigantea]|uniref:growth hormone secretagogue receptor type 1-like n=1 Tax=Dendronephthya gigantea TaxID=151771 RepID=UPI001068D5DC|nr:growth hormone secretagogue receptor type 1-like [Dendronephthya gigantea]